MTFTNDSINHPANALGGFGAIAGWDGGGDEAAPPTRASC